jgi:hypothetical protein
LTLSAKTSNRVTRIVCTSSNAYVNF